MAKIKLNQVNDLDPTTLVSAQPGHPEYNPRNDLDPESQAQKSFNKVVAQGWNPTSTLHGILYPDGQIYLREGNKRKIAATAAGMKTVPVFVTEHDSKSKALPLLLSIAGNARIETPLGTQMLSYAEARKQGATVAEIAATGVTEKEVIDVLFVAQKFAEVGKKPKKDETDSARQVREMENKKAREEILKELNTPGEKAFKIRALLAADGANEEDRAKFILSALRSKKKEAGAPKTNRVVKAKKSLAFTKDQLVTLNEQIAALAKKHELGDGETLLMTSVTSLILGDIDMEAFESTVVDYATGGGEPDATPE